MTDIENNKQETLTLTVESFSAWIKVLVCKGYIIKAPVRREQAICIEEITSIDQFPRGWRDEQEAGHYRLEYDDTQQTFFNFTAGPQSWKQHFFPPERKLCQAVRHGNDVKFVSDPLPDEKAILLGVRACDIHAIEIQDKVFLDPSHLDPFYENQRRNTLIVAVNCSRAGKTCFCTSMDTGPKADHGFDLALTEINHKGKHYFTVEVGSKQGRDILGLCKSKKANDDQIVVMNHTIEATRQSMGRRLNSKDYPQQLMNNLNHPRWEKIAETCMSCANCTMVCPTCFCSSVEDTSDLTGEHAERWRRWDSCFTLDHSYLHGGSVRQSIQSRYRQWLTHKFSTWHEQFDSSGCVGCGRCITWCPVEIDVTEELNFICD